MNDYLDREDILDIVSQYCTDDDGSCSKAGVDLKEMLDEIEALPAADVQPVKRGKWVNGKCTICEKSLEDLFTGDFYYDDNEINFCPNCGSDMRGDKK